MEKMAERSLRTAVTESVTVTKSGDASSGREKETAAVENSATTKRLAPSSAHADDENHKELQSSQNVHDAKSSDSFANQARRRTLGDQMLQEASRQITGSNKFEEQINLQHLVELMKIFHVRS